MGSATSQEEASPVLVIACEASGLEKPCKELDADTLTQENSQELAESEDDAHEMPESNQINKGIAGSVSESEPPALQSMQQVNEPDYDYPAPRGLDRMPNNIDEVLSELPEDDQTTTSSDTLSMGLPVALEAALDVLLRDKSLQSWTISGTGDSAVVVLRLTSAFETEKVTADKSLGVDEDAVQEFTSEDERRVEAQSVFQVTCNIKLENLSLSAIQTVKKKMKMTLLRNIHHAMK
nr:hypothetical protein BaRGS_034389 [Batillaria attramentaria]